MKQVITALLFFLLFNVVQSQNYDNVDARVAMYPKQYASANQLADQIAKDFTTDRERARAIYTWLAINVSYDLETLYNGQTQVNFSYVDQKDLKRKLAAINTHTANQTLRTNKAICEGYAQAFKKTSELMGIPCMLVGGFSKGDVTDIGVFPSEENHAWNAVKINNKWYLVDATWGAGYSNGDTWVQRFNDFFFLTDPDEFALTHFPSEPEWLFTKKRFTKKQFYETPFYEKAFFKNKLNLLSPLHGELIVKSNSAIEFIMAEIPKNVTLYYAFKGNKYSKRIEPSCINGKCYFKIPFTDNKNTELLIFANERTALQYKIKLVN